MINDECELDLTCVDGQAEFMNECFDCGEGCSSCSFDGTALTCNTCDEELVMIDWTCQSCPDGTAKVGKVCQDCPEHCDLCEGEDLTCTSCESGYSLN